MTMREVAVQAGVSYQLVWCVEQGQNTTIRTLEGIARALQVQLSCSVLPLTAPPASLPERFALAARLLAVLPRLPDDAVAVLAAQVREWER